MATRRLPLYLHYDKRIKQYRYRRPDTKKSYWMGNNRLEAIDAANELNQVLVKPVDLLENVIGKSPTLNDFLDERFVPFILPQRKLAKSTLKDYLNKIKVIQKDLGKRKLIELNTRVISEFLLQFPANHANRYRGFLRFIFKYAIGEGWMEKNHAADTIPNKVERQRRRLNYEEFSAIYREAEPWLKNAMDLALITLQRRADVLNMKFEDIKEGFLYVIQQKTKKHGESAYLQIEINEKLKSIIDRCQDGTSTYFVHRASKRPAPSPHRTDDTQVLPDFLSHSFSKIRDKLPMFQGRLARELPSFHEIRALGIKLYKKQGIDPQRLAGHTQHAMTEVYMEGHEVEWTKVEATLLTQHF